MNQNVNFRKIVKYFLNAEKIMLCVPSILIIITKNIIKKNVERDYSVSICVYLPTRCSQTKTHMINKKKNYIRVTLMLRKWLKFVVIFRLTIKSSKNLTSFACRKYSRILSAGQSMMTLI